MLLLQLQKYERPFSIPSSARDHPLLNGGSVETGSVETKLLLNGGSVGSVETKFRSVEW